MQGYTALQFYFQNPFIFMHLLYLCLVLKLNGKIASSFILLDVTLGGEIFLLS